MPRPSDSYNEKTRRSISEADRAHKRWTPEEEASLLRMVNFGHSHEFMAHTLGRSIIATQIKLHVLRKAGIHVPTA